MSIKADLGDVFMVPIGDGTFGIGQIAGDWKGELYLIIYDATYPSNRIDDPRDVCGFTPLLSALSLDAKIYNGDWPIVGNIKENLNLLPQPAFKVEQHGRIYVESCDRKIIRIASDDEQIMLRYRKVVAPIRLESALKAHRQGEWKTNFDELRSKYSEDSSKMFDEV